jgi:hypothetical protein
MVLQTIIATLVIIALVFVFIGVRILLVKNGEFRGTCASNNPMLTNQIGECTVCGKRPDEDCKKDEISQVVG